MTDFLIRDFSLVTDEDVKNNDWSKIKYNVLTEDQLYKLIEDKNNLPKISVYKLGDCIIDWT